MQDQASYGRLHLSGSVRFTRFSLRQFEQSIDRTYYRTTPRVGATFDVADGVALFAGYATGFRGAVNFIGMQPPKPETSRNVEGGIKLAMTRIGLSGTIAAFRQTRNNVTSADPNNPFLSIQTDEPRARGLEADLTWEPTNAFSVLGNYAYTQAEVTQDSSIPIGDRLPRVPRHSGRIAAHYRVLNGAAKGLSFGAGITAFSQRQLTLPNTVAAPGYAAVDTQAGFDFGGKYTLALSVVNLTGRNTFDTYQYLSAPVVIPTQPRSAYVTLKTGSERNRTMTDLDRRTATLFALLAPLAAKAAGTAGASAAAETSGAPTPMPRQTPMPMPSHQMPDMGAAMNNVPWMGDERIAMLVYPGMTVMDLVGPHCMFGSLMGAKIYIVAKSLDPVTSDAGMTVVPDATFETCPRDLTVLFTPGGTDGTLAAAADPATLAFMADRGARAKYVTSVCSGSLILGAAGLLKGYQATSHWSCLQALAGFGAVPTDTRVVQDRNRITGAGVTAGLDFGLTMVAELRDKIYAECTQLVSQYDPHSPFDTGSMRTARAEVRTAMVELLAGFTKKAEASAKSKKV